MGIEDLQLNDRQRRQFRYMQRKHNVSSAFLCHNKNDIQKFLVYAISPHAVLRTYAIRSKTNRIILHYGRLRRLLFEPRNVKMIKRRKKNIKQWSRRMVALLKSMGRIKEYEETETYAVSHAKVVAPEEVTKQLKAQLELLKSGKRVMSLMDNAAKSLKPNEAAASSSDISSSDDKKKAELTPEKQIVVTSETLGAIDAPAKLPKRKDTEKTTDDNFMPTPASVEPEPANVPFLDRLISKVRVKNFANETFMQARPDADGNPLARTEQKLPAQETEDDSSEDFLGFDDSEHQPGMLLTPLVPKSSKTKAGNSAFVSESLNEYMRKNNLFESSEEPPSEVSKEKVQHVSLEGLVTAESEPPHMDMPAVPESLQKLRTVAERRQYLQRFSKTHKMVLINNEANVYRELQRKARQQKVKAASMLMLQAPSTQMPFTRSGWQAASYVATDYNKYYYQTIKVDGVEMKLPGALGNNEKREKPAYNSKVTKPLSCSRENCVDAMLWRDFKIIKSKVSKAKLNHLPLPPVFRPCPLSHKAFQKPIDDDTAALLLAGGSMAVVSMPTVELQIFPEIGKPLNEIAKRYLQYILPHHDISREWAKFSVSTLQLPHTLREAEKAAAKTVSGLRKSFTFAIPYINDRSQILVRRVVDRSEKLDESFEQSQTEDAVSVVNDLSFRTKLDQNDAQQVECADILSGLINAVAISCSENSFIKEDPDGQYGERHPEAEKVKMGLETIKIGSAHDAKRAENKSSKYPPANRQARLRLELRRLNATVIEAPAKCEKEVKPCTNDHCQLGCVCESIASDRPMREHCGKASCVLECRCKAGNHSRIMRLETDGRGISNEDAFMLRRRATARLAPMEKEFTSTVVLTENETLLINESQRDKKRRCTKAPKRYEDFADTDEDFIRTTPKKPQTTAVALKSSVMAIDTLDSSSSSSVFAKIMELREPCSVLDKDFEKLKHFVIPLRRLPDMTNVAVYCMTHQLYKCFCGGDALEGKPVVIEKEEVNTTIPHNVNYIDLPLKARYSFDKVEKTIDDRKSRPKDAQLLAKAKETPNEVKLAEDSLADKPISRNRPYELDVIYDYYSKPNAQLCRRVIVVPTKCYTMRNRKRKQKVNMQILKQETPETASKLNSHIDGAMRFYRSELEMKRKLKEARMKMRYDTNVIELCDDDDDEGANIAPSKEINPPKALTSTVAKKAIKRKAVEQSEDKSGQVIKMAKTELKVKPTQSLLRKKNVDAPNTAATPSGSNGANAQTAQPIQMPRISACFSLSGTTPAPVVVPVPAETVANALPMPTLCATPRADVLASTAAAEIPALGKVQEGSLQFKEFYQDVVKNMNGLVSKKMQDIDMALQRDSKLIPAPNEEILCIIKWTNFLAAFESEFVFIWEVKMRNYSFLAATLKNMMPIVCGAIGVVNILGLRPENLPLLAQMLLQRTRTDFTERLAIVMQGRKQYWLVKGYLLHMSGNACTKPTPQTHPLLTKKINHLCSLLVKQRIKEHQRCLVEGNPQAVTQPANVATTPPTSVLALPTPATNILPTLASTPTPTTTPLASAAPAQRNQRQQTSALDSAKQRQSKASSAPQPSDATPAQSSSIEKQLQDESSKIKSNVEFRKVYKADVDELMLPERNGENHRWLVLDLYNDFSHIFVPAFKDMISLDRIHNVMSVAREKDKIVKLQFFQNAPYDAFVTPASQRKIYFGPLKLNMTPPLLVLLQSVDGRMMLREVYQREHNIIINVEERTTAFWVLHINGQVHFEIEMDTDAGEIASVPKSSLGILKQSLTSQVHAKAATAKQSSPMDSDDDDCVIIDDEDDETATVPAKPVGLMPAAMKLEPSTTTTSSSGGNKQQRVNFTIQAKENRKFQITQLNNSINSSASTSAAASVMNAITAMTDPVQLPAATVSAPAGFLSLVPALQNNGMPANASSFILAPLTATINSGGNSSISSNNNDRGMEAAADAAANGMQSTYLTPQVKMTPTMEPETFSECQTQTPPLSKKSRISINSSTSTSTSGPMNQAMVNLLSPLAYLPKDTTLEFEKTKVGSTTITRLNESNNKNAASSSLKSEQAKDKQIVLNGRTKVAKGASNRSTVTSAKMVRTDEVCLKRTASGSLKTPKLLTTASATSTATKTLAQIRPKVADVTPTKPLNKMEMLFSSDNPSPSIFRADHQTNKATVTKVLPPSIGTQVNKQRLSLPTLASNSKLPQVALPTKSTPPALAQKKQPITLKIKVPQPNTSKAGAPGTSQKSTGSADKVKISPSNVRTDNLPKLKPKPVVVGKITASPQKSLLNRQQTKPQVAATNSNSTAPCEAGQESLAKKLPRGGGAYRFGYIYANQMPKFLVKVMSDQYLVKVPNVGIIRLKGMKSVNNYLNSHLVSNPSYSDKLPAQWLFMPQKSDQQQKSPSVIEPAVQAQPARQGRIKTVQLDASKTAGGKPATTTGLPAIKFEADTTPSMQKIQEPCDPILIDD